MQALVLDTNVVLDAFVFRDARTAQLVDALAGRQVRWIATREMRSELECVLAYPLIAKRLALDSAAGDGVLARFDALATLHEPAPRAPVACTDEDDQKFIDLAWHHRAALVSKDRAVLKLRARLLKLGCPCVTAAYESPKRDSDAPGQ